MIVSLIISALFVASAVSMFFRKLPALLALPLMAAGIGLVEVVSGNLSVSDASLVIFADGAVRLYEPMVISMFGGILSVLLQKSGVAESIVRRGAELAGDNPWLVSMLMTGIVALLFTTIGGLGAVIMVGTIVLPILASIGVREIISAGILLFGISIGGLLNANNWALYTSVLRLDHGAVASYALTVFGAAAAGATAFITVELVRSGNVRLNTLRSSALWMLAVLIALAAVMKVIGAVSGVFTADMLRWATSLFLGGGILLGLVGYLRDRPKTSAPVAKVSAYLTTVVPLLMILVFDVPYISAFLCGIVYGWITTLRRGSLNMLSRCVIEGSSSVVPAVVLMIGIGMLISAILGPTRTGPGKGWYERPAAHVSVDDPSGTRPVTIGAPAEAAWPVIADMKPLIESIVPRSKVSFVVLFALLAPLALYRGPLNVWGLGYGVGGVLLAAGVPAGGVMGILMSLGIIQGVSDPTNTQNVWIANELRVGVNDILWRTFLYAWGVAVLGLAIAALGLS